MNSENFGVFGDDGRCWFIHPDPTAMRQFGYGLSYYKGRITVFSAAGCWVYNGGQLECSSLEEGYSAPVSQTQPARPYPQRGKDDPFIDIPIRGMPPATSNDDAPLARGTAALPLEMAADYAGVGNHYAERY